MPSPAKAQRLRVKIAARKRERLALEMKLLHPKPMLEGSPVAKYILCGNAGCVCRRDQNKRHGPYWYLTFQRGERSKTRYIGGDEGKRKKVFAYKRYQANLAALRRTHKLIDEALCHLRDLFLERPDEGTD